MQSAKHFAILLLPTLLAGCWSTTAQYKGVMFPQTIRTKIVFQENNIPDDCMAFAHVLMSSKAQSSGKDLGSSIHQEAENKGADLVLIGMTREMKKAALKDNRFDYYGPEHAYNFNKTWLGWKFGFDQWNDANNLIGLDAQTWEDSNNNFNSSLLIQAVFLRCGQTN